MLLPNGFSPLHGGDAIEPTLFFSISAYGPFINRKNYPPHAHSQIRFAPEQRGRLRRKVTPGDSLPGKIQRIAKSEGYIRRLFARKGLLRNRLVSSISQKNGVFPQF